jgi:hypothetical protein
MNDQSSKFCCRYCHAELGVTDGLRLIIASVMFASKISLRCLRCQVITIWRPVGQKKNTIAQAKACVNL